MITRLLSLLVGLFALVWAACGHVRGAQAEDGSGKEDWRLKSAAESYAEAKQLVPDFSGRDTAPMGQAAERADRCSRYLKESSAAQDAAARIATVDGSLSVVELGEKCSAIAASARARLAELKKRRALVPTVAGFAATPDGEFQTKFGCSDAVYFRVEGDAALGNQLRGQWFLDHGISSALAPVDLKPGADGSVRGVLLVLPDPNVGGPVGYSDYAAYKALTLAKPGTHTLSISAYSRVGDFSKDLPKPVYNAEIQCPNAAEAYATRLAAWRARVVPQVKVADFGSFEANPRDREWHGRLEKVVKSAVSRDGYKLIKWTVVDVNAQQDPVALDSSGKPMPLSKRRIFDVLVGVSDRSKACSVMLWNVTEPFDLKQDAYDSSRMTVRTTRESEIECSLLK